MHRLAITSLSLALVALLSSCGGGRVSYPPTGYTTPAPQPVPLEQVPAPTATATRAAAPAEDRPIRIVEHTIVAGDSLWRLARDHDTRVVNIKELNQLETDVIQPGQVIKIPTPLAEGEKPAPARTAAPTIDASTGLPPARSVPPAPKPVADAANGELPPPVRVPAMRTESPAVVDPSDLGF